MARSASKRVWVARVLVNSEPVITRFYRDETGLTPGEVGRRLSLWIDEELVDDGSAPLEVRVQEKELTSVAISIQEEFGDAA